MSSDMDILNLDYKRTNNVYIYLATMRIMVVGLAFHLHLHYKLQYMLPSLHHLTIVPNSPVLDFYELTAF